MVKIKDEDVLDHFQKIKQLPKTIEDSIKNQTKLIQTKLDSLEVLSNQVNKIQQIQAESAENMKSYIENQLNKSNIENMNQMTIVQKENKALKEEIKELKSYQQEFLSTIQNSLENNNVDFKKQLELKFDSISAIGNLKDLFPELENKIVSMVENLDTKLTKINHLQENNNKLVENLTSSLLDDFNDKINQLEQNIQTGIANYLASILPKITADLVAKFEILFVEVSRLREQGISEEEFRKQISEKLDELSGQHTEYEEMTKSHPKAPKSPSHSALPDRAAQDIEDLSALIRYFKRAPPSKNEGISEVERVRDTIMFERATEASYRVTLSKIFRVVLDEIRREDKEIQRTTNRSVVHHLEQLMDHIRLQ